MSIRGRLALWYGALTTTVVLVTALFSYVFHTRGHYDDRDLALITSVSHVVIESSLNGSEPHLVGGGGGLNITLRLYDGAGRQLAGQPGTVDAPTIDPHAVIEDPSGPAYDALARLVPPLTRTPSPMAGAAFGIVTTPDQRWRVYVEPVAGDTGAAGYVAALMPLGQLDAAMRVFRLRLIGLGFLLMAVGFIGSGLIAGSALRPISQMIQAAQGIAFSHDFTKRIKEPRHQDELGHLASTFNEMMGSLEEAFRAQQRFVADASHELRAPLTAIQANLELLEHQPDMLEIDRRDAVHEASREAHRLARLVADLLVLARADARSTLPKQRVEVERIVLEVIQETRLVAQGRQVELVGLEAAVVLGNRDRLKQLFIILLDNAVKYTPPDGRISICVKRSPTSAIIIVEDTGIGIPDEAMPHLFERFYRADPARSRDPGGTGLGLSIAGWIVEQHDGQIVVESQLNSGTTVAVSLPLYQT